MFDQTGLRTALEALSETLRVRGLAYELVCIGGASLLLLGVTVRPTKDLDVLGQFEEGDLVSLPELPPALRAAIADVGAAFDLPQDWINSGPRSLVDLGLPTGFMGRLQPLRLGASLTLHLAGRIDQVFFKTYAAADQGPDSKHVADLRVLSPTRSELLEAARWSFTHDPSPAFRIQMLGLIRHLGHEVDDDDL